MEDEQTDIWNAEEEAEEANHALGGASSNDSESDGGWLDTFDSN